MSSLIHETPNILQRRWKRRRWFGLLTSFVMHAGALAGLMILSLAALFDQPSWDDRAITVVQLKRTDRQPDTEQPPVRVATEPDQVEGGMVEKKLNETIAQAESISDEEKREKLDQLGEKLNQVSSAESLDKLSSTLRAWVGTKERASRPADEPVAGDFDFDTAQVHDVRREDDGEGGWNYWAMMVDAGGRSFETEVSDPAGEKLYKGMQRMKANPLMEKVYRQFTLPLFDKLFEAREAAARNRRYDDSNLKQPDGPSPP